MRTRGNTAIKAILAMGIFSFLFLALVSFGLRQSFSPNTSERVIIRQKYSPFDRARAWQDLNALMAEDAAAGGAARDHIKRELSQAGVRFREQRFEEDHHSGLNLVARIEGDRDGVLLLGAAYNTGVVDREADAAWLLETARAFGPRRHGCSLWLAWMDGGSVESSRALLESLRGEHQIDSIRAMLYVSQIGDAYLGLARDEGAPAWLQDLFRETAVRLGYGRHFSRIARDFSDAQTPFREAGIPALLLMDFQFGGSPLARGPDTPEASSDPGRIRAESLQAVADVFYHALPALEAYLDRPGGE
jgi:hypothetical protein